MTRAAQRFVSAGVVLAIHVVVISALVIASHVRIHVAPREREIEIVFPIRHEKALPLVAPILPELFAPVTPQPPPPSSAPPLQSIPIAPNARSLSGVGRALFGCDPTKLDTLSPEDRAACLRLPRKAPEQSVRIGSPPDPNSPFEKVIEERFREAVPINRPCPQGSYNDTHGLPCFDFSEKAPLLRGY